ncbi:hypothetical protein HQ585_18680 [candidate division KSB1 bacterium]|nr:hypothetical protein [candidate division KSB1 bacterium]
MNVEHIIENLIPDKDTYILGYADMGDLLQPNHDYRYAISIAKELDDEIIDSIENGPNEAYYHLYHSTNNDLNTVINNISSKLNELNIENEPVKATIIESELNTDYREELRYHTSHKMIATRAGLGWIGKTDLLITTRFGPRVRLASILVVHQ